MKSVSEKVCLSHHDETVQQQAELPTVHILGLRLRWRGWIWRSWSDPSRPMIAWSIGLVEVPDDGAFCISRFFHTNDGQ